MRRRSAAALLVVHGDFTFIGQQSACRIPCLSGMGCLVLAGERYTLESDSGAIILIVEADILEAHGRGIARPERIAGQHWPCYWRWRQGWVKLCWRDKATRTGMSRAR